MYEKEKSFMDKYINMKNPPRFSGEWKFFAFFLLELLTLAGYKPANVAFTSPTKINVTRETKNRNNELKEQLLRDIKQDIKP